MKPDQHHLHPLMRRARACTARLLRFAAISFDACPLRPGAGEIGVAVVPTVILIGMAFAMSTATHGPGVQTRRFQPAPKLELAQSAALRELTPARRVDSAAAKSGEDRIDPLMPLASNFLALPLSLASGRRR